MGEQMKAKGQRIRDIARILQNAGYSLARGDAARVETALEGQPAKTATVVATAKTLGFLTKRGPSIETTRREAIRSLAVALVEADQPDAELLARCYRNLADQTEQVVLRLRTLDFLMDQLENPLAETVVALHHTRQETGFYAVVERIVCDRLMARLAQTAEDLVHAQSDAHIDALATIATYPQAARLIERCLTDGGPGRSLVSRYLRKALVVPTEQFLIDHVQPRGRILRVPRTSEFSVNRPQVTALGETTALV